MGIRILYTNQNNNTKNSTTSLVWINDLSGETGESTISELSKWIKNGIEVYIKTGFDIQKKYVTIDMLNHPNFTSIFTEERENILTIFGE